MPRKPPPAPALSPEREPAARTLLPTELLEVERLSRQGLDPNSIAVLLGIAPDAFREMANSDPRIYQSVSFGRARGIERISKSLYGSAASGSDSGAARFYLERIGGGDWRPPRATPPTITVLPISTAQIDQNDMARRFQRQRTLVDGTCDELDQGAADGR